jgi:5'-nucleotidase
VILNVNVPDLPSEEIKGVKVCPLSYRAYNEQYLIREDEGGRAGYYYKGRPQTSGEAEIDESDIIANELGYITITPLHFDLTDRRMIGELRDAWTE